MPVAFLGLVLASTLMLAAVRSSSSLADDEIAGAALDTQYQQAVKQNDVATMDRILADDFVLVTGRGRTQSKADLLKESASGTSSYEHQEATDRTVRIWGDTALLSVRGSENGKPLECKLWFSDVYLRTPTGWRYVFAQPLAHSI